MRPIRNRGFVDTPQSDSQLRGVVLVTELFPPDCGGSAELFGNIYPRLVNTPVTVVRPSARPLDTGDPRLRLINVRTSPGHWGISGLSSLANHGRVAARLVTECRRRPSVIHCARALPEGLDALLAARLSRATRYLCWTHGEELHYASTSRELTFLQQRVHRAASAVVANCGSTARALEAVGVPRERIRIVYPGVDAQRFDRGAGGAQVRQRYAAADEILLVTVGRLQKRKGHDLVIEALAVMRSESPRLRYLVVGDGAERGRLEQLARDRAVQDRVTFTGGMPAANLPDYYAAADIFVHPNRIDDGDVEGFGIVFLEAAAAGVPAIGGASGGVPEAVQAGVTGLLVSGTDSSELAHAIRTLLASETLRRQMGDAGRRRVRADFTWERAAAQVLTLHHYVSTTT
jgi:phosphatidylinositol alpha-1,6-mannosyltransferase